MTNSYQAVILKIERALPVDGWPPKLVSQKSNRLGWSLGRLLLFVRLNEQAANTNDNQGVSEKLTVCNHRAAPFPKIRGQEGAPCQGANRPPSMAALKDDSFLLTEYHGF